MIWSIFLIKWVNMRNGNCSQVWKRFIWMMTSRWIMVSFWRKRWTIRSVKVDETFDLFPHHLKCPKCWNGRFNCNLRRLLFLVAHSNINMYKGTIYVTKTSSFSIWYNKIHTENSAKVMREIGHVTMSRLNVYWLYFYGEYTILYSFISKLI